MFVIMVVWLHLILHGDFCSESVVGVPLLGEVEAQVAHFVFGLQVTWWLPRVSVVGAWGRELLQDKVGWSDEGGGMEMKWEER